MDGARIQEEDDAMVVKMNKNKLKMQGMRNAFSTRHFPLIPDSVKL